MNKLFLQYIQEKQKNNFEMISFKNSMRKNCWQKSLSLIENEQSPGQQRKRFPLGNIVSRSTPEDPQQEPAVEASTDPVNPLNRLSKTTALLSTSAHEDAIETADLERIRRKYGIGQGQPATPSTESQVQPRSTASSSEQRPITLEFENDFSLHSSGEPQHDHHNFTFEGLDNQGRDVRGSIYVPREDRHDDEVHRNAALERLRAKNLFPTSLSAIRTNR